MNLLIPGILLCAALQGKPFAPVKDDPDLPRVLLIGDSISIGYTVPVREALKGKANVHRAPQNCGPTVRGLEHLDRWLGAGKWDVIHFNFGLHDLKYVDARGKNAPVDKGSHQVKLEDYGKNLRSLVERLKKTGAKLIWCSTTPVPEGARSRVPGDEVKYNAAAAQVMGELSVPIHDLHSFAKPRLKEIQRPADVHFTPEGSRALGGRVAGEILKALRP